MFTCDLSATNTTTEIWRELLGSYPLSYLELLSESKRCLVRNLIHWNCDFEWGYALLDPSHNLRNNINFPSMATPVPRRSAAHTSLNKIVRFPLRLPSIDQRNDLRRASGGISQPRKGKRRTPATLPTASRWNLFDLPPSPDSLQIRSTARPFHGQRESSSPHPIPISLTSQR
jgi:hypothetical protein